MTAKEKATKARAGLILDRPFFGSLALRLRLVEDPTCKTGWTDGGTLGYNPDWIKSMSLGEVKGFVCHEVMHIACQHTLRRGSREPLKANIAADYAINPIIVNDGIELPKRGLINNAYKDMYFEQIYDKLPDTKDGNNGKGDSPKQNNPDPGGCGEVRDAKNPDGSPLTESQIQQQGQQIKVAVVQAAQQEKSLKAGKLPAGIQRLIDEILEPKADWKTILRVFVDQAARTDYSWLKPNVRYLQQGFILPSLKSEEMKDPVIVVDSSGSTWDNKTLSQFNGEMTDILQSYNVSCTVIYCDTKIQNVEHFSVDDLPLKLNPKGGGGTDFKEPFRYVEEHNLEPSCLIYLTDLCCSSYPEEPEYPVLWAKIGNCRRDVPFGEIINL